MNRKTLRIASFVFISLAIIVFAWLTLVMHLFTRIIPNVPDPVYSADRSRIIIPSVNFNEDNSDTYLLVHLEVQESSTKETLFQVQTRASHRMRWSIKWIDNNTVMLESSDIGSDCWIEDNSEVWKEFKCP